jgi:glutamyl-Q tRNA(Asp) synthetase
MLKTRFAPSPTGLLHLGNIYSALQCQAWAKHHHAGFILRIEDIDFTRCKPKFSQQIMDDLNWIGIGFDDVSYQSQSLSLYKKALNTLIDQGVLYPCFCTRKAIAEQTDRLKTSQLDDYAKICLALNPAEQAQRKQNTPFSWRLDSARVKQHLGNDLYWLDNDGAQHDFDVVDDIGDVIIGRKDIHYSYHLAVVVDDAAQGISHVIRGQDLQSSTPVHRVLQLLLGYASPKYIHHGLIQGEQGKRLAKSKGSPTLLSLREQGMSPQDVLQRIKKASLS